MGIPFYKVAGSGNDFIIIDNRKGVLQGDLTLKAELLCRDRFSIGANGLILLNRSDNADFSWRLFNADGSEAAMCGNGARCVVRVANLLGIAGKVMSFETKAGLLKGFILDEENIKIELTKPEHLKLGVFVVVVGEPVPIDSINTGVPHVVCMVEECIEEIDLLSIGSEIRHHQAFAPEGTNVNLVEVVERGMIKVRTYERGVEDETMACGTGSVAAVLISGARGLVDSPVEVMPTGGKILKVYFSMNEEKNDFSGVFLEGDAVVIYQGEISPGALQD